MIWYYRKDTQHCANKGKDEEHYELANMSVNNASVHLFDLRDTKNVLLKTTE